MTTSYTMSVNSIRRERAGLYCCRPASRTADRHPPLLGSASYNNETMSLSPAEESNRRLGGGRTQSFGPYSFAREFVED